MTAARDARSPRLLTPQMSRAFVMRRFSAESRTLRSRARRREIVPAPRMRAAECCTRNRAESHSAARITWQNMSSLSYTILYQYS